MLLEPLAIIHPGFAAEHVDRSLMRLVLMRFRPPARWNGEQLHVDARCAHSLRGDGRSAGKTLLADIRLTRAHHRTASAPGGRCRLFRHGGLLHSVYYCSVAHSSFCVT